MRDPATEQFARNVYARRKMRGFSQEDLGAMSGLHRTEISLLERAQREPRLSTIVRLAGALQVPPAELLNNIA